MERGLFFFVKKKKKGKGLKESGTLEGNGVIEE
jgi:hypothetical protein